MDIWKQGGEWVILAEKPSVAKHITKAISDKLKLGISKSNGYNTVGNFHITWAFGHLLTLAMPDEYDSTYAEWQMHKYPILPEQFKMSYIKKNNKIDKSVKNQLDTIIKLCSNPSVTGYIMATDYDREGQLIGQEIFSMCPSKVIYRMLLNEWTPQEVDMSLSNLLNNSTDPVLQHLTTQGFNRLYMDWLMGMNYTPMFSLAMSALKGKNTIYNLGRVIMPTLKILYERNNLVQSTKHLDYLNVVQEVIAEGSSYKLYLRYGEDKVVYNEPIDALQFAQSLKNYKYIVNHKSAICKLYAPKLFSMTSLQKQILSKHKGFTSDKVLSIAQTLYEKGLTTYPRTESNYLDNSIYGKVCSALNVHLKGTQYEGVVTPHKSKRIFDSSKVHSHSAIIPTNLKPEDLTDKEQLVYWEILKRFISNFMPPALMLNTDITLTFNEDYLKNYNMSGTIDNTLYEGWKVIDSLRPLPTEKIDENSIEIVSPNFKLGKASVTDDVRSKPKPMTEQELLTLMESCGRLVLDEDSENLLIQQAIKEGFSLGTSATRSAIIDKLVKVNYVYRAGNTLTITRKGMDVIEYFPNKELLSPNYVGQLESKLRNCKDTSVLHEVIDKIKEVAHTFNNNLEIRNSVGKCPLCGFPILDGKLSFGCTNYEEQCMYHIHKSNAQTTNYGINSLNVDDVQLILSKGYVINSKGQKIYYHCDNMGSYYWEIK